MRILIVKCLKLLEKRFPELIRSLESKMKKIKTIPGHIAIFIITFYRHAISPLLPSCCRFHPTCSEYGLEAFKRFGFIKALYLTGRRILRCRPGGPHGYDPVPESFEFGRKEPHTVLKQGEIGNVGHF